MEGVEGLDVQTPMDSSGVWGAERSDSDGGNWGAPAW